MPGRAQVDIRLPAQLGRSVQVAVPLGGVTPIGQTAVVDARLTAGLLERQIGRLLPRLAGRGQPVPGLGRPALARPALYIEHRTQTDPAEHDRLMHGLNGFLERDQDRALFDLPANTEIAAAAGDLLPGWRPHRLNTGDWGAIYHGDTSMLPTELVGSTITVQAKNGQRWTVTVTAVLDRSHNQVLVTDSGRPTSP